MKKATILCIIALALVTLNAKLEVTPQGKNSLHVVWTLPSWQTSPQGDYIYLQASGLAMPAEAGAPLIPYDETKIAIPQGGNVSVSVTSQASKELLLEKRLQPVPQVIGGKDADVYQYLPDEKLYAATTSEPVTVLPLQRFRKLSFVPVRINPFIYDGKNRLKVATQIEFTITINGNLEQRANLPMDDLTALLAKQMLNPAQAANWQITERTAVNFADFAQSDNWVRLETDKDGMYKITPGQLDMLPINDIDPRTFRLFTTGGEVQADSTSSAGPAFREVPLYVSGESDGSFGSSDYILFYGRDREGFEMNLNINGNQYLNPYSKTVCYWLTFSSSFSGSPSRIVLSNPLPTWNSAATTTPETVRVENETFQRTPDGFDWYMRKFFGNSSALYAETIDLEDPDTAQSQTFSLLLKQEYIAKGSTLLHKVRLNVNGVPLKNSNDQIQEWAWSGLSPIIISHTGNYFAGGSNDIQINVLRNGADNLFFDYYQVAYKKKLIKGSKQFTVSVPSTLANQSVKYDFTGNNSNVRVFQAASSSGSFNVAELPVNTITGGFNFVGSGSSSAKYLIAQESDYYTPVSIETVSPVDLTQVTQSYDNIIITPADYFQQAQSLVSFYNQKWQKSSQVVLLQDIFNQFNAGMPDPNAIRLFLKYCVDNYPAPAITTVTLLGSGTNDWRNHSGQSATKNKLIVYQKGTTTTDDYFAMLNTEQYPELAIGRYPAKTQNELNIMLSNLDNYVNNPQPGIWRNSLLFMADDQFNGPSTGEYSHSEQLQTTSNLINGSVLIDKIFAIEYDYDEFQNKPQAREDMFKAINDGKLIWYYIGHGSFDTLGAEDYFNGSVDMNRFDNPGKLPLFIAASCDVAQFDSFSFDSAAEKVVLADNRGAIASIAATRACNGPSNVALLQHYYNYSINQRNPIGFSLVMAKVDFTEYDANDEKYNILGDPLLWVNTPERDNTLTIQTSTKDDVLHSREQVSMQGEFPASGINDSTLVQVFNSDVVKHMPNNSVYTIRGEALYRGNATVNASQYNAGFIVPDDVTNGESGLIMSYVWDSVQQKDYVNYLGAVSLSDQAVASENLDAPDIRLYLNSLDYQLGDIVSADPLLIAKISDQNGINITNSPGHNILLIFDQTVSTTNITDYFNYDTNSFTAGTINYPLTSLSDGPHTLQLIAFDNFNRPSVASTNFTISKSKGFSIESFMPYPNPMQKDGWFTFVLPETAEVKLSIYTIRGKKIKTITASAAKGYNQLTWDGRDADGDFLANGTYFIKLIAKSATGKGKAEKTEKLVIYH